MAGSEKWCAKKSYPNREHAENAMRKTWRYGDGRPKPVRAYQCDRCGLWHLTSKPLNQYLARKHAA